MKELTILKTKMIELSERLKGYIIYAPYRTDKIALFDVMKNVNKVILHFGNTVVPPKKILFPQTETLFKFKKKGDSFDLYQPSEKNRKIIIFGIRPCDARSFLLLDKVFSKDVIEDPYYKSRRENTILMGLACNIPHYNCFCTSVGGGPHSSDGLDVLWTEMEDNYYVEIFTKRGEKVLKNAMDLFSKPTEKDRKLKNEIKSRAEKGVIKQLNLEGLKEKLANSFNDSYWAEEARKCIGCGACTYLCPTCHCFDINDYGSVVNGKRVRTWDSCQFPDFTMHTSGHNPRPNKMSRLRQRLYHKFKYSLENYELLGCVGCGRCINRCPVNLDIVQILNNLKERA